MMVRTRKPAMTPARLIKPLGFVCFLFYLLFHTFNGERGMYAWVRDRHALASLQEELKHTKAERERVELRVSHMRDDALDLDLLDEQMRRMLGVMKPTEVVILDPTKAPAASVER